MENKSEHRFFDHRFSPINELPITQYAVTLDLIRQFAIAIVDNDVQWFKNNFINASQRTQNQLLSLFIIYNQLGDEFLEKSNHSKLKYSTLSGYALHLTKAQGHEKIHQILMDTVIKLGLYAVVEGQDATKDILLWQPKYFLSTLHFTNPKGQDRSMELRLF